MFGSRNRCRNVVGALVKIDRSNGHFILFKLFLGRRRFFYHQLVGLDNRYNEFDAVSKWSRRGRNLFKQIVCFRQIDMDVCEYPNTDLLFNPAVKNLFDEEWCRHDQHE